eukprot:NODE_15347_length_1055_cov_2.379310.p1 GENE.NODE_15347_length_1055_cov_2.379310~~NODE_15347_length_1055_cov_2.379310.p1  ORF type:complete len:178 (-),score=42.71 NODE_15347_length_1055_cov_2.379310:521-1009(-)
MVYGIINCFAPLFWAVFRLFVIMYACAVFFLNGIGGFLANETATDIPSDHVTNLQAKYGSLYKCMTLLFEGVTGGADWGELSDPLKILAKAIIFALGCTLFFVTLGVLNTMTGFFVDGKMQASLDTREEMVKQALAKKAHFTQLIAPQIGHWRARQCRAGCA